MHKTEINLTQSFRIYEKVFKNLEINYLSGDVAGSKGDDNTRLDDTCLHTAHRHCSNTTNLVDILQGQTQRFVSGALRWYDAVQSVEQGLASRLAFFVFPLPSFKPTLTII